MGFVASGGKQSIAKMNSAICAVHCNTQNQQRPISSAIQPAKRRGSDTRALLPTACENAIKYGPAKVRAAHQHFATGSQQRLPTPSRRSH